ncbi:Tex family protein [Gallaecimonas xiamenensis]|uniref:RNA binding S1 domain-containing protein n=1 Tax=Gallaecimonas xiamenensis 3-C-1 TaxID=745411 RepID=K2KJN0_9GAMM|nr:Tex family protein [Gallaecimonas xiamenensis]EKE77525.1 RNA binding S1 domain-containing protein [Gallaecimonas xiamenensis 3-C-1]
MINNKIAEELGVREAQVSAAVALLDEGSTVPFIARYRKEVTGGLDDTQLRNLESRLGYLRELEDRRQAIIKSIDEQGKLTDQLKKDLLGADTKTVLEELYLPYKPKRRTKGQIAIEQGLEPLADELLNNAGCDPQALAEQFVTGDVSDVKAALEGARYILMERFAEDAALLEKIRSYLWGNAQLTAKVMDGKEIEGAKFSDYFSHSEPLAKVPSHRALAMLRGRNEGILALAINADPGQEEGVKTSYCELIIAKHLGFNLGDSPRDTWLKQVLNWTWRIKILMYMETELMGRVRDAAETEAIKVFGDNLKDLLMAAPAGPKVVMGLDPGIRTGCKVALVDDTGKVLGTATIYPFEPKRQYAQSIDALEQLCRKFKVDLIAIGNGTASRETDRMVAEMFKKAPDLKVTKVVVSEAGASVYSASELAANEFPDLDVSLRGAVSIARRLQDPLAELVKIDPKSIGVGQYQHDVNQSQLAKALDAVVEDCVNGVGVDLNTASVPLLARVSGLNSTLAGNLVAWRNENGAFKSRKQLLKVPRLGPKAFEQCAGFLRIMNGDNPLDASGVHPEAYPVVEKIKASTGKVEAALIGNSDVLRKLKPGDFVDAQFGLPTVTDILKELDKPGRDPRPEFTTASFAEGVETLNDLKPGMVLEGVVTNVTNFGAFVDIGVHQDGLVHISAMSERRINDPREVVKAGLVVKVKVMEVDIPRKRIALSMRLSDEPGQQAGGARSSGGNRPERSGNNRSAGKPQTQGLGGSSGNSAMADALKAALKR